MVLQMFLDQINWTGDCMEQKSKKKKWEMLHQSGSTVLSLRPYHYNVKHNPLPPAHPHGGVSHQKL